MSNINNLTSKIIKDAEDKKEAILSDAEREKNKILSKKEEEARTAERTLLENAEREAISRKERIISSAKLQARNEKLQAKQEIIREVFQTSIEALCNISEDDYKEFVKVSILNSNIDGNQKLILSDLGKKIIDKTLIDEIDRELGTKASLTLSKETRNFKGGFILEKEGVEINNTFEALVNSLRDDLSQEIAEMLFS